MSLSGCRPRVYGARLNKHRRFWVRKALEEARQHLALDLPDYKALGKDRYICLSLDEVYYRQCNGPDGYTSDLAEGIRYAKFIVSTRCKGEYESWLEKHTNGEFVEKGIEDDNERFCKVQRSRLAWINALIEEFS